MTNEKSSADTSLETRVAELEVELQASEAHRVAAERKVEALTLRLQHRETKPSAQPRTSRVEFFWMASTRDVVNGAWYWEDADCEEPMGPFDSSTEARADYAAVRKSPSSDSTPKE